MKTLHLQQCPFSPESNDERRIKEGLDQLEIDEFTARMAAYLENVELPVIQPITTIYPTSQKFSEYKDLPYGKLGTIGGAGCGPLAIDYALKVLGFSVAFENIVDECVAKGYRAYLFNESDEIIGGAGSEHDLFDLAKKLESGTEIISALQKSQIVTVLIANAIYTGDESRSGNHFITLIGIDEQENAVFMDGNKIVDPAIPEDALVRKPFRAIASGLRKAWAWDPEKVARSLQ